MVLALQLVWNLGEMSLRDELVSREIVSSHRGALVLVERWLKEYNRIRLHNSLDHRPPAPEAIEPTVALASA